VRSEEEIRKKLEELDPDKAKYQDAYFAIFFAKKALKWVLEEEEEL